MKKLTDYVIDRAGNAVPGSEVYVRKQGDSSLVLLYSDNGVTGTANPTVTDNDGEYSFYTANNDLKLQVYIDGVEQNEVNHIQHYDLSLVSTFGWTLLEDATAGDVLTTLGVSSFVQTILNDADGAAVRVTIGAQALDATLTALAAHNTNGLLTQTAADTFTGRTITGTANEVTVANGDGVAGNPTLSLPTPIKTHTVTLLVSDPAGSAITTGDGKAYYRVPSTLNGCDLVGVAASLSTVSSSGIPTVQIRNATQTADMLTTKLTVDATETDSATAANAAVIDAANDDVATGDQLYIDIDVAGTGAKGLVVEMQFRLP